MSTIKLNGTTSGSSIIKAPDSGSTNQTFTLPASSGTLVTTTDAGVAGITSSADATAITIDSSERVGIGATSMEANLHIKKGDSGAAVHGSAALYIENNADTILQIGSPNSNVGRILFSDPEDSNIGDIKYTHSTNTLSFRTNDANQLELTSDGRGLSQFTAKVWVHIDSGALADGHNVSSITDNGTGEYQVNFANNLANDNYSSTTSNPYRNGSGRRALVNTYNPNVNNINIAVFEYNHSNSNGFYAYDLDKCTMTIFGD